MYSTVEAIHIAIDARIQQLNSNRKQAIHPEQYDMAINDAIFEIIKTRSSRLNAKQEGFEESIKRYEDLQSLKKDHPVNPHYDGKTVSFFLPSDYYSYNIVKGIVKYNRNNLNFSNSTLNHYVTVADFSVLTYNAPLEVTFISANGNYNINTNKFSNLIKSNKSRFYYFALVRDYIKNTYGIDCYLENFNGSYYPNSIIFVTTDINRKIVSCSNNLITISQSTIVKSVKTVVDEYVDYGIKKIELVSSKEVNNINNDFYSKKNIHLNPKFTLIGNKIVIPVTNQFSVEDIVLEYIKLPRLVDSRISQMTDVVITDEIVDLATTNLLGILGDTQKYQISKSVEQLNN